VVDNYGINLVSIWHEGNKHMGASTGHNYGARLCTLLKHLEELLAEVLDFPEHQRPVTVALHNINFATVSLLHLNLVF